MATNDAKVAKRTVCFSPELLETGWLADVEIKCGNQSFNAHKLILCGQSKWFRSALVGDFLESKTGVINITDFKATEVAVLLKFLYTGSVEITSEFCDNADNPFIQQMHLLHLAEYFQVIQLNGIVYQARDGYALTLGKQLCRRSDESGQVEAAAEQLLMAIGELYSIYHSNGTNSRLMVTNAFRLTFSRLVHCNVNAIIRSPRFRDLLLKYSTFATKSACLMADMICHRGFFRYGRVAPVCCAQCQEVLDPQTAVLDTNHLIRRGKRQMLCNACFEQPLVKKSESSVE